MARQMDGQAKAIAISTNIYIWFKQMFKIMNIHFKRKLHTKM